MKKTLLILLTLIIGINLNTQAHGFSIDYNGVTIYYEITSSTSPRTVSVTYEGNTYSSFNNEYSGAISIPDSVLFNNNYFKVTSIDDGTFYNCSGLTSITIPNSITSIGDYAFYGCSGLTSIAMPNSITSIGDYAFRSCSGLTSITIPNSVTSIGGRAFDGTPYYNNIPNGVVYINNILYGYKGTMPANTILNIQTGTINISPYAFFDCSGLTSITIPTSVTSIGDDAFSGCTGLTSITIPNSVTSIGDYAFRNCSILASITIPNSVTSIGGCAFDGTPYYNNKPNGVVYVNDVLYKYKGTMPANTIINIQTGTVNISQYAFYQCTGLTSITIPNSVTSIGDDAFSGCTGLTSITIPNSVTSIGDDAFSFCDGLTSITLSTSITSISDYAFAYCRGLTSISIPSSVTSIGSGAFYECSGLTSITIPDSVSYLGRKTFAECVGLTSITCNAIIPPIIFTYSFQNVDKSIPFYVPCNSISLYQQYQYWSDFTNYRCTSDLEDKLKFSVSAKLYPNPTTNNISKLEVEGLKSEANVLVYDLFGRFIKSYKINPTMKELEIDLTGFAKGIYSVSLKNNDINVSKKLIVQ